MRFLSVCSGIEAASVAWNPLGWEAEAFSEIEPFPCQVLKHHYPNVPNLGDMTKFKEWNLGPIDLFCGGTPCQSFSVAGLRKGLDDPRGNLMLTYLAIADKFRPRWLVWENVPGVLSSDGGRDFGAFLGGLGQLGYGFAYRVLDAQYFGVAQRRKRVFVVGYLGDWRPAAAVLFERDSLCGNPAPSRKARKEATRGFTPSIDEHNESEHLNTVAATIDATDGRKWGSNQWVNQQKMIITPKDVQPYAVGNTLTASMHKGMNSDCNEGQTPILHPVGVPDVMATLLSSTAGISRTGNAVTEHETYIPMAIPIDTMNHIGRNDSHSMGDFQPGAPSYTLTKCHSHAVAHTVAIQDVRPMDKAQHGRGWNDDGTAYTIDTHATQGVAHPFTQTSDCLTSAYGTKWNGNASATNGSLFAKQGMAVRRLTPTECERLQGFPDNYTDIKPKGKPTPDGPRYKALGNSWAVPVVNWIGKRIMMVEELL